MAGCGETGSQKEITPLVRRNGTDISYTVCGTGDTTLLFIHGWCINKEYWQQQVAHFCPRYKVVAIDLPGFGQSGKKRTNWSFTEYTDDVKAVIDQLGLKNVWALGHSMSGDILLQLSNKYPESVIGIVGVDNLHEPGAPTSTQQEKETAAFFTALSSGFDSTVSRYMVSGLFQPSTDSSVVRRVMNDVYTSDSSIAIAVLRDLTIVAQQEQTLMQGLSHPLFLINSDVAPVKLDSLNKYCRKGARVFYVHGTGHYPMIEKAGEFNKALEKVLAAAVEKER
jgi:pimeloyl-ACP methyl ester carboxylesterase